MLSKLFVSIMALTLFSVFVFSDLVSAHPQYGKIIFSSMRDGNSEIYTSNTDGTGLIRLTSNSRYDADPSYSSDGSKIVYHVIGSNCDEIFVMNADGTGSVNLTSDPNACENDPEFSPDGSKIVYSSEEGPGRQIFVMNSDGTNKTQLTNTSNNVEPTYSPDGTKIAFREGHEIYTMNSDGSGRTNISNNVAQDHQPAYSPDGSKIGFASTRDDGYEVYTMNTDGSNVQRLTDTASDSFLATFSPDGTAIIYTTSNDIYLMNSDGSNNNRISVEDDILNDEGLGFEPSTFPVSAFNYSSSFNNPTLTISDDLSYWDYTNFQGTLIVNGQTGDVTAGSGNTVKGSGVVGILNILSGGTLAPGQSPGCLSSGNLTLAGTFEVEIAGNTVCTDYDQTQVTGTVDVSGGSLDVSMLNGFEPVADDQFIIIDNDSTDDVAGTFSGLDEGATINVDGIVLRISYVGGTGNDVALTVVEVPQSAPNTGVGNTNILVFAVPAVFLAFFGFRRKFDRWYAPVVK